MGKNEGQKQGQPVGMEVKKIAPQIIITGNPGTGQLHVNPNFKDWNQAENMLIDALRAVWNQRTKEEQSPITVPQQRIILSGP